MKKSTRLIALILTLALAFGCISFGTFADESAPVTQNTITSEEELPVGGTLTIDQLKALVPEGDQVKMTTAKSKSDVGVSGDNFTTVTSASDSTSKVLKFIPGGTADKHITIGYNKVGSKSIEEVAQNDYNNGHMGKSFVLSFDLCLDKWEPTSNRPLSIFMIGVSQKYKKDNSTYQVTTFSVKMDGTIYAREGGTVINEKLLHLPIGGAFNEAGNFVGTMTRITQFVDPVANTVDLYINGELAIDDAVFAADPSQFAGFNITLKDGTAYTTTKTDCVLGSVRMLQTSASSVNLIGYAFDNLAIYYADRNLECKHSYIPGPHTHDLEKNALLVEYVCKTCGDVKLMETAMQLDALGRCVACMDGLNTNVNAWHDVDVISEFITASGVAKADIVTVWDGSTMPPNSKDNVQNLHIVTDESGNAYVSHGKTYNPDGLTTGLDSFIAIQTGLTSKYVISGLKDGTAKTGDFVIQLDFRLEEGYRDYAEKNPDKTLNILRFSSYLNDNDSSTEDTVEVLAQTSGDSSVQPNVPVIRNGKIQAGGNDRYELPYGEFVTCAYHAHPAENTYDVYVNGELIAEGLTFINENSAEYNRTHFKYDTGKTDENGDPIYYETGVKDFVLGWVRPFNNGVDVPDYYLYSYDNAFVYYSDEYVSDYSKHEMEVKTVTDLGNGYHEITYMCDDCHVSNKVVAKGKALSGNGMNAVVLGKGADLGEYIGFDLYAEIDTATIAAPDAAMVISVGDTEYTYPLAEQKRDAGSGVYVFRTELTSIEMCKDITAKIVTASGETGVYATSFAAYAEELIAATDDVELDELLYATLSYGAYAQEYFAAYRGLEFTCAPTKYYSVEKLAEADAALTALPEISDGSELITPYAASLVLESTVTVKVYFKGDAASVTLGGKELEITEAGELSYVLVEGIMPHGFGEEFILTLTDSEGGADTLTLSVLDCAAMIVDRDATDATGEAFKNLARALYFYNETAKAYVNN